MALTRPCGTLVRFLQEEAIEELRAKDGLSFMDARRRFISHQTTTGSQSFATAVRRPPSVWDSPAVAQSPRPQNRAVEAQDSAVWQPLYPTARAVCRSPFIMYLLQRSVNGFPVNLLPCNCFARLATQPAHPTYTAVFRHSFRCRYDSLTLARPTATWHTFTPFYPWQTPTGPAPCLRPATCIYTRGATSVLRRITVTWLRTSGQSVVRQAKRWLCTDGSPHTELSSFCHRRSGSPPPPPPPPQPSEDEVTLTRLTHGLLLRGQPAPVCLYTGRCPADCGTCFGGLPSLRRSPPCLSPWRRSRLSGLKQIAVRHCSRACRSDLTISFLLCPPAPTYAPHIARLCLTGTLILTETIFTPLSNFSSFYALCELVRHFTLPGPFTAWYIQSLLEHVAFYLTPRPDRCTVLPAVGTTSC
jgi:hypothetical protein